MNNLDFRIKSFGIVQGRLTIPPAKELQWFPQVSWQKEFEVAKDLNIDFIELLSERTFNPDNPIWNLKGREAILNSVAKTGRKIYSICSDYIIDHSLIGNDTQETIKHIDMFLECAKNLGCQVLILPLLEKSNLDEVSHSSLIPIIKSYAQKASKENIKICIESIYEAKFLKNFLEEIDEKNVSCVFDTGNRIIQIDSILDEIEILGKYIGHVHIKDKNHLGENVLLGTGLVNFLEVFEGLKNINYCGPLVFETTRGQDPIYTAFFNMCLCNFFAKETNYI